MRYCVLLALTFILIFGFLSFRYIGGKELEVDSYLEFFESAYARDLYGSERKIVFKLNNNGNICVSSDDYTYLVEDALNSLVELLNNKFYTKYKAPYFSKSIEACPQDSFYFISLHHDRVDMERMQEEMVHVAIRNHAHDIGNIHNLSYWGNTFRYIARNDYSSDFGFVAMALVLDSGQDIETIKEFVDYTLIEEFFHLITQGVDIDIDADKAPLSILQEPKVDYNANDYSSSEIFDLNLFPFRGVEHKLCLWDLVSLYFLSGDGVFMFLDDYVELIMSEYVDAVKYAESIVLGGAYQRIVSEEC